MFDVRPVRVERPQPSARARFQTPWVPFPTGGEALRVMRKLLGRPHEGRPLNLALIGDADFGKSNLLDFFVDHYPDQPDADPPQVQILHIDMPAKADGAALVRELLNRMGSAVNRRDPLDELVRKFCVRAESLRVLMIVIDEFNNGAWGRREASMTLVHAVRVLNNRLGRPFVIAGTPELDDILRNDSQLNERFFRIQLPRWDRTEDVMNLIATFALKLSVPLCTELSEHDRAAAVMEIAGPKLGRIAILLREADRLAVSEKAEWISKDHLARTSKWLPGSRV